MVSFEFDSYTITNLYDMPYIIELKKTIFIPKKYCN